MFAAGKNGPGFNFCRVVTLLFCGMYIGVVANLVSNIHAGRGIVHWLNILLTQCVLVWTVDWLFLLTQSLWLIDYDIYQEAIDKGRYKFVKQENLEVELLLEMEPRSTIGQEAFIRYDPTTSRQEQEIWHTNQNHPNNKLLWVKSSVIMGSSFGNRILHFPSIWLMKFIKFFIYCLVQFWSHRIYLFRINILQSNSKKI